MAMLESRLRALDIVTTSRQRHYSRVRKGEAAEVRNEDRSRVV